MTKFLHNQLNAFCHFFIFFIFSSYSLFAKDTSSIESLVREVRFLAKQDQLDSAKVLLSQLKHLSESENDLNGVSWYYLLSGERELLYGNYEESLKLLKEAERQNANGNKDPMLFTTTYIDMGIVSENVGNDEEAVNHFLAALKQVDKIEDNAEQQRLTTTIYLNLSRPFINIKDWSKALDYLKKGMEIAEKNNLYTLLTNIYINNGICYRNMNELKLAEFWYKKGLAYSQKYNLPNFQQSALINIGSLLIKNERYQEAITYLHQATAIDDGTKPFYTVGTLSSLGAGYYYIKDYQNAEQTLLNALAIAKEYNVNRFLLDIQGSLYKVYAATKNPTKALEHLTLYTSLKDSIDGVEMAKNIQQLEVRYTSALKDKKLAEHGMQLQKRKNQIIILFSLISLLIILAFAFFRYRNKLHRRKIRILQQRHELEALKFMLNGEEKERQRIARELHDGIGGMVTALNIELGTIQQRNSANIQDVQQLNKPLQLIKDIASEIRNTSRNLMPEALIEHGLADALRQYCTYVERMSGTTFDLQFYGDLEKMGASMELSFYRIIQEIVQNIIKHAKATQAVIQLREYEGVISLHAEDNGQGFDIEATKQKGLGLSNINYRVQALRGYFSIASSPNDGTTIHIEVDIDK